jgi:hypothetical protein
VRNDRAGRIELSISVDDLYAAALELIRRRHTTRDRNIVEVARPLRDERERALRAGSEERAAAVLRQVEQRNHTEREQIRARWAAKQLSQEAA